MHIGLNILFISFLFFFFLIFFSLIIPRSLSIFFSTFPSPTQFATTDPHHPYQPIDPHCPHQPSPYRPTLPIAHLPPFADLASPSHHRPISPTPTQATSRCCHPSLLSLLWLGFFVCFHMGLVAVVVVVDFDSGFVELGCDGGGWFWLW